MEEAKQSISAEFNCSVCYNILVEPVKLPCAHYFCFSCVESMRDLEGAVIRCPMCRSIVPEAFKARIDNTYQEKIRKENEREFDLRLKAVKLEREKFVKVGFEIGNQYEEYPTTLKNKHEWTVYVRLAKGSGLRDLVRYIQEVKFVLDESFYPPFVVVRKPPFELTRLGWGTFPVGIEIKWRKELNKEPTSLHHDLVFKESDNFKKVYFKFERQGSVQKQVDVKPKMKF